MKHHDIVPNDARVRLALPKCFRYLLADRAVKTAVKYLAPDFTVRVTRQRKEDRRQRSSTFLVTVGKPNFLGRKFVKDCLAAEEPFPVRKVQLQRYPKRKGA